MIYTVPDYYKEFKCIADACPDTCCAGWQIGIDDRSLKKYKNIKGSFRRRMLLSVDWFHGTFRQDAQKRCAFLNDHNLCDLYLNQGKEGFCKTCREYPRHTEEFEGVREISLSLSCPEVARILMDRKEPVKFFSYEREGEEEFEDFDPFLFSVLEDAREAMLSILQNRKLPMRERACLILGMAHDMQGRMNRQEMFDCMWVIDKYKGEKALAHVQSYLAGEGRRHENMDFAHAMFRHLYELEVLKEDWNVVLSETEALLYGDDTVYGRLRIELEQYLEKCQDGALHLEQLLVYFLFTYFPGAVYDGEIYAKAQFSVYCVFMIWELWMARWLKNGKQLNLEEMTELVYRFSREVEHSDLNLRAVENLMGRKWFL